MSTASPRRSTPPDRRAAAVEPFVLHIRDASPQELDRHFGELNTLVLAHTTLAVVAVFETPDLGLPGSARFLDWMGRHERALRKRVVAYALATPTFLAYVGALSMVWLGLPMPARAFRTQEDALSWARERIVNSRLG